VRGEGSCNTTERTDSYITGPTTPTAELLMSLLFQSGQESVRLTLLFSLAVNLFTGADCACVQIQTGCETVYSGSKLLKMS
jgi:hypothetical protein